MVVFIAEGMQQEGLTLLHQQSIRTVCPSDSFDKKEIDVIVVRSVFQINNEVLAQFSNLKIVAKLGTGLDNIDQDLCRRRNIKVLNAASMNSVSAAEFAVMQVLNVYKRSFEIYEKVKRRDFRRESYYGHELQQRVAGIIGYGSVGSLIAERLKPFVSKIHICDKMRGDINQLLSESDIVILAVSLKNNEKMVNKSFLAKVKPDVTLVNIARGGLVEETDLMEFLKKNEQARYYCDVLEEEPDYCKNPRDQNYQNPLLELPNVLFTPHIAGMTEESQSRISLEIAGKIIETQEGNERR